MKIHKRHQIEKAVSKKASRFSINAVKYEPEKSRVVATDGYILAVVPVEPQDGDAEGYLSPESLEHARKLVPRTKKLRVSHVEIKANERAHLNGVSYDRPSYEGPFPDVDKVLESTSPTKKSISVVVDVTLLSRLCQALGDTRVRLVISGPDKAVRVESPAWGDEQNSAQGVLMPMRDVDG